MNKKTRKIIYWVSTILMCGIFTFSAQMYLRNPDRVAGFFEALSYPTNLVYPLAVAKILGIIAVLSDISKVLKEWAYAGFFFDALLATLAHYVAGHEILMSGAALVLVIISRVFWDRDTAQVA